MADNTTLNTGTGGDVIATDDISGVKYQRVKVNYGTDGFATDVDYATPLPVDATSRASATGTITTSTSTITLTGAHGGSASVFIYGTYAGVSFQVETSPDGTNWFTAIVMAANALTSATISTISPGTNASAVYIAALHGATQVRVRATAFTSGTANVVLVANGYSPFPARSTVDFNSGTTNTVGLTAYPTISAVSVLASSAYTVSGNSSSVVTPVPARNAWIWISVTAVSGTSPTLTIKAQFTPDSGTTWIDVDTTNLQTPSITATGTYYLRWGPDYTTAANAALKEIVTPSWRLSYTITGTTPSFTLQARVMWGS